MNAALDAHKKQCGQDASYVIEGGSSDKTESQIIASLRPCAVNVARAHREFAAALRAGAWPAEATAEVDALAKYIDAGGYIWERMSKARSTDEYRTLDATYPPNDGSSKLVRARLGLPQLR